jgi:hypothetical protein
MKLRYKIGSLLAFNALALVAYELMLSHFVKLIVSH